MSTTETGIGRDPEDESRFADLADREPQSIEREIDATRADMRATLEALERRLSFDRLIDLTVGRIRARGGEFAGNLTDAATQNPMPLLLTSIGLGWMMLTSRRGTRHHSEYSPSRVRDRMSSARESAGEAADKVRGAVDSTRETLRHAAESTRETLKHASESSRETLDHAAESLRMGADRAREGVDHARARMDRLINEQPLMLGAFGLAAGAILGALLPTTEYEDRWVGDVRDKAVKKVSETSRASYETAREHAATYSAPGPSGAEEGAGERPASRPH